MSPIPPLSLLQVTHYAPGQHFGSHEDAFPTPTARSNGFQRRATVLLYLNDCPEGGRTQFDLLGVRSGPRRGSVLVFFPAFADGEPDDRRVDGVSRIRRVFPRKFLPTIAKGLSHHTALPAPAHV